MVNLIKNYDLSMEGTGLANIAAAIATAQGEEFEQFEATINKLG